MVLNPWWELFFLQQFFKCSLHKEGEVFLSLWIIKITSYGLSQAALIFMRFLLIILFSTLLTLTTTPLSLADAVESLLKPLKD